MLKKVLLTFGVVCILSLSANADSFDRFMNKLDKVLDAAGQIQQMGSGGYSTPTNTTSYPGNYPSSQTSTTTTTTTTTTNSQYGDNLPQYEQPQMGEQHEYTQPQAYKGQATTLGALPAGTFIIDPTSVWTYRKGNNYTGEISAKFPVIWRKLEDNHYSQGSTLLLSEVSVANYSFCIAGKGIRDYGESDLRKFLRGMFYNHLSTGFKNAIVNVNLPYADLNGNAKTITDNIFPLSIVEWNLSSRDKNGKAIKYDDLRERFSYKSVSAYDEKTKTLKTSWQHLAWTRTINRPIARSAGYTDDVFLVRSNGVLDTYSVRYYFVPVRPAVNLKSSTKVKGPYKQSATYYHDKADFIYYIPDFSTTSTNN